MSLLSFSQNAITMTAPNPGYQPVNNWPAGNSWLMTQALFNDVVNINAATVNVSNANTFTATQTFNAINVTSIGATTATAGFTATGLRATIVSDSANAAVTLTAAQSNSTILLKRLNGDTVVLPTATTANLGVQFTVLLVYSSTSVGHTVKTGGTDVFYGTVFVGNADSTIAFTSTANKTLTMTPTTTGGLRGGKLEFTCIGAGIWATRALLYGSGSLATPFLN